MSVGVGVGVAVGVGLWVGVRLGVAVTVGVGIGDGVSVGWSVAVTDGVGLGMSTGLLTGRYVAVAVFVSVKIAGAETADVLSGVLSGDGIGVERSPFPPGPIINPTATSSRVSMLSAPIHRDTRFRWPLAPGRPPGITTVPPRRSGIVENGLRCRPSTDSLATFSASAISSVLCHRFERASSIAFITTVSVC